MSSPTTLFRATSRAFRVAQTTKRTFATSRPLASQGRQPSHISTPPSSSPLKVWPILGIFALGSFLFKKIVDRRKEEAAYKPQGPVWTQHQTIASPLSKHTYIPTMPAISNLGATTRTSPLWSPDNVTVLFVLGGPGAGKGTQCQKLVADYGFKHLSAGDLLREEQDRPGSEFGEMIKTYIKEGTIVPMEVTVQLLENAMKASMEGENNKGLFLIDGFPRKLDQAHAFERTVVPSKFTLFFDCSEAVMEKRLLRRGETSGRADDNMESIKKRFRVFVETSMPVVTEFESQDRVVRVNAEQEPDDVYKDVVKKLGERGVQPI
ncbi:adenylate kinase-domain-containing protein [Phaeosphaeria sp. MPI-PUGE-AT-0046c]|nr:adenylate kinase-domain-containing protein [Phaeosphaeria sp. MPI-PUGE-AT-0046c]